MKKLLVFLFMIFTCVNINTLHAETITVGWLNDDGTTATTTTCESGGDLTLPSAPTKTGYTFVGWEIPKYYPLEYIENIPGDSHFDTGFFADENTKVAVDSQKIVLNGSSCTIILNDKISIGKGGEGNYATYEDVKFGSYSGFMNLITTQRYTTYLGKDGWYKNDSKKKDVSTPPFTSTTPIGIFNNATCTLVLYSVQLYQNNVLVHDYVPALDGNGVVCLYDKVTDSFLYNSGTEPLVAGPIVNYD